MCGREKKRVSAWRSRNMKLAMATLKVINNRRRNPSAYHSISESWRSLVKHGCGAKKAHRRKCQLAWQNGVSAISANESAPSTSSLALKTENFSLHATTTFCFASAAPLQDL